MAGPETLGYRCLGRFFGQSGVMVPAPWPGRWLDPATAKCRGTSVPIRVQGCWRAPTEGCSRPGAAGREARPQRARTGRAFCPGPGLTAGRDVIYWRSSSLGEGRVWLVQLPACDSDGWSGSFDGLQPMTRGTC